MSVSKVTPSIAPNAPALSENAQLKKVSKQFEAIFLNQMIESMRKTVTREGGLIPESSAERTYRAMLDAEYAQQMAESEQIGLSRVIYQHLLRSQGGE